ncbi:MAG TPA: hypothetical protein VHY59_08360, partial [Chthoniobacterales bacterium]|nr:hypothetical protein [Chthoniobacterales bacterium]
EPLWCVHALLGIVMTCSFHIIFGGMASAQLLSDPKSGSITAPQVGESAQFYSLMEPLLQIYSLRSDQLVVDHELRVQDVVSAKHIFFHRDTKLVLSDFSLKGGIFYIVADQIDIEGAASVSWIRQNIAEIPPDRQKAADGGFGRGDGAAGGPGGNGQAGNVGYPGRSAPTVVLAFRKLMGGVLSFDLRGEPGGIGGTGQGGGSGGDGAKGTPASQSLFDCKRGPGPGGKGGDAGNGGLGGGGGTGGNGGDLVMFTTVENAKGGLNAAISKTSPSPPSPPPATASPASGSLVVYNSGGEGGAPGQPGRPGLPGQGGDEGEKQLPFCNPAGRKGAEGSPGSPGSPGQPGTPGAPGRFVVVPLPDRLIHTIYGAD